MNSINSKTSVQPNSWNEQLIDMQYLINVDVNDKSIRHFRGAMYKPAELELLRNTVNQEKRRSFEADTVTFSNGQSELLDVIVFLYWLQ